MIKNLHIKILNAIYLHWFHNDTLEKNKNKPWMKWIVYRHISCQTKYSCFFQLLCLYWCLKIAVLKYWISGVYSGNLLIYVFISIIFDGWYRLKGNILETDVKSYSGNQLAEKLIRIVLELKLIFKQLNPLWKHLEQKIYKIDVL